VFSFKPRWKEQLVVRGPGGAFVLELPMGILSAYLPTEAAWREKAPDWVLDLWPQLKAELEEWCRDHKARFHIDETANVWPFVERVLGRPAREIAGYEERKNRQMPNGEPGDHPWTDIVVYRADVYSALAAALVREIATLADDRTKRELAHVLNEKFNPQGRPDVPKLERYLTLFRDRLRRDASARGFEADKK